MILSFSDSLLRKCTGAQRWSLCHFPYFLWVFYFLDSDLNHRRLSREGWVRSPPHEFWQKYHSAPTPQYQSVTNFLLLLFYASLRDKIHFFVHPARDLKNIEFTSKPREKSSTFFKNIAVSCQKYLIYDERIFSVPARFIKGSFRPAPILAVRRAWPECSSCVFTSAGSLNQSYHWTSYD